MAIQRIDSEGLLRWQCVAATEEGEQCLNHCSAHVSEAVYRPSLSGARGAMIDLPTCPACGAVCSLKADYSYKELFNATLTVRDDQGGIIGYSLKMPHVYNLLIHHWLHRNGRAGHAPVVPLPVSGDLNSIAGLPGDVALAIWFGYAIVQQRDPRLTHFDMIIQELAMLPVPMPIEGAHYALSNHGGGDTLLELCQHKMQVQPE